MRIEYTRVAPAPKPPAHRSSPTPRTLSSV